MAGQNVLYALSLDSLRVIVSYGDLQEIVRLEATSNGRIREVLQSDIGRTTMERLLRQNGHIAVTDALASHNQLKILLGTLNHSSGIRWNLATARDVANAVAAATVLNRSSLWPQGRMWSHALCRGWTRRTEILDWPLARNRWSSHSKRAVFTMPQAAVEYLLDVWGGKRAPNTNDLPDGISDDIDDEDVTLFVESNSVGINVTSLNGVVMNVNISIELCLRTFPEKHRQHLMFILGFRSNQFHATLDRDPQVRIGQQFRHSIAAMTYFSQDFLPPDLFFLSVADSAVVGKPLCVSYSGADYLSEHRVPNWRDGHSSRRVGIYESITIEEIESDTTEEAPRLSERLNQWLEKLTADGMRVVIGVEDPALV